MRAIVAIRSGQFGAADQLLTACVNRTQDSPILFPRLVQAQLNLNFGDLAKTRQLLAASWADLDTMRPVDRKDNRRRLLLTAAQFYLVAGYPEKGAAICRKLSSEPVRFGANTTQNAAGWRAALYLTAFGCEKSSKRDGIAAAALGAINCADLKAKLYNEMNHMIQGGDYLRDPFDFLDGPSWLWPILQRSSAPSLIGALRARVPFHGWRQTAYGKMIETLAAEISAGSPAVANAKSLLPPTDALTSDFMDHLATRETDFFAHVSKLRLEMTKEDHIALSGAE